MINDRLMRIFFMPIFGITIPLMSGFYPYQTFSFPEIIVANCYFIFISFCIWNGGSWIIYKSRYFLTKKPFFKITILCILTVVYASIVATILSGFWQFLTSPSGIDWETLFRNTLVICG